MDIIDIMLAKAMTPQGKTDAYVAKANKAAAKAAKAEQDAAAAIATVDAAAEDIAAKVKSADDLLAEAQNTLETAQAAQINLPEVYTTTGQNTDGYMTQKAVTDALEEKADLLTVLNDLSEKANAGAVSAALALKANQADMETALAAKADKTYVDAQIANIPSGGGSSSGTATITFDPEDEGRLIIIDENGHPTTSVIDEDALLNALLQTGNYTFKDAVGLDMNYSDKIMTRVQSAVNLSMGSAFDKFKMYGGRMRCNVANDGTINAFYGDIGYKDDGTNGQVMVYQPKFYYQRAIFDFSAVANGKAVRHEQLLISDKKLPGFKLAPIFDDGNGSELEYALFSAYEGSMDGQLLSSRKDQQPVSNITTAAAETAASARGTGWHISSMAAESANQMLQMVEYGTMNGQEAFESGISYLTATTANVNCSAITGSTAALGNASGHATTTRNLNNGTPVDNTTAGTRAISYRGLENPWGNMWSMIGDINIKGDGQSQGGKVYICTDKNYTPGTIGSNYEDIGFNLPNSYGWISAMGLANDKYDWIFLPAECAGTANSSVPVGDNLWVTANTQQDKILAVGGSYNLQENNGLFYYAADRSLAESTRINYGARLMFIPTKNAIYTANIAKWTTKMGE